jgi:hypothetical protein
MTASDQASRYKILASRGPSTHDPLPNICLDGVEIAWPDGPECDRPRAEVLSDIAIGMAGIASESAYRFGRNPEGGCVVRNSFTEGQIDDFRDVHELVDEIDRHGADDILFDTWRQAVDLVANPVVWAAIERLAAEIQSRN